MIAKVSKDGTFELFDAPSDISFDVNNGKLFVRYLIDKPTESENDLVIGRFDNSSNKFVAIGSSSEAGKSGEGGWIITQGERILHRIDWRMYHENFRDSEKWVLFAPPQKNEQD
ncbi:MAG: hypothetical protein Q4A71_06845 [Actinomycetaceae bacterium]|nr:hypothetical protein [Actinomycetaceae bacterium]